MSTINQNLLKGLFLVAIALFFGVRAIDYRLGSLDRAGPGLFPLLISAVLLASGSAVLIKAWLVSGPRVQFNTRNIGLVTAAVLSFAVISEALNALAGLVALVMISAAASERFSWSRCALIIACLAAIALAMKFGLGFQLPLY